jgi:uncharacterized protein (DUF111 family)
MGTFPTMKLPDLDCFAGISGYMLLGVDARVAFD